MNEINFDLKKYVSQTLPLVIIGKIEPEVWQKSYDISKEDFLVLDNPVIKIAEIKEFLHFISLKPYNSKLKLAVIVGAENMTADASNALLKTLEEPPPYARIILTTLNEAKILPTILSRCVKIKLPTELAISTPENYLSPEELAKMNIHQRFSWVESVEKDGQVFEILTLHQEYFRAKLLTGKDTIAILSQISGAKDLLETNISVKLLLENLVLNYEHD